MTPADHERYDALEAYARIYAISVSEVAIMINHGILEVQHELSGPRVVPCDGLTHEEAVRSWLMLGRIESLHLHDRVQQMDIESALEDRAIIPMIDRKS